MPSTSFTPRPALAALAAAPTATTIRRLWKALTPAERALGISAALADDENGWVKAATGAAGAGGRRVRAADRGGGRAALPAADRRHLADDEAGERSGAAAARRRPAPERLHRRSPPRPP